MTDDERIADIEESYSGYPGGSIYFLLRVIRDQRAELTQARQVITNMRQQLRRRRPAAREETRK